MGRIYIDRKYFGNNRLRWVSFESNPRLSRTKRDIYEKCVPCITSLYEQLREGRREIRLGAAYQCWKIVVPLRDMDECVRFLSDFEEGFLDDMDIKGRFGSGDPGKKTRVIVFNAEGEAERDRLRGKLRACARGFGPGTEVLCHRACADLYHELLGNGEDWGETSIVRNMGAVGSVLERIRRVLFWKGGDAP